MEQKWHLTFGPLLPWASAAWVKLSHTLVFLPWKHKRGLLLVFKTTRRTWVTKLQNLVCATLRAPGLVVISLFGTSSLVPCPSLRQSSAAVLMLNLDFCHGLRPTQRLFGCLWGRLPPEHVLPWCHDFGEEALPSWPHVLCMALLWLATVRAVPAGRNGDAHSVEDKIFFFFLQFKWIIFTLLFFFFNARFSPLTMKSGDEIKCSLLLFIVEPSGHLEQ